MARISTASKGKAQPEVAEGNVSFMSLPPEVLGMIVERIPHRQDLSKLSKTCKSMKAIVFPVLYSHLVLEIPQKFSQIRHLESLLASPCEGLPHVTSLKITTRPNDEIGYADETRTNDESGEIDEEIYPPPSMSAQLNLIVRLLLQKIPRKHLADIIWDHECAPEDFTLECLHEVQPENLTTFEMNTYAGDTVDWANFKIPSAKSFSLTSMNHETSGYWIAQAINSSPFLEHLCLGAESCAYRSYKDLYPDFHEDIDSVVNEMVDSMREILGFIEELSDEGPPYIYCSDLTALDLKGLNVSKLFKADFTILNWQSLTSLTLESCRGIEHAFEFFAENFNLSSSSSHMRLKLFSIRHDSCDQDFRNQLVKFLVSIPGLINLSVLLETKRPLEDFEKVMSRHGKSLKTLLWDERKRRQDASFPLRRTNPLSYHHVDTIARCCPNLTELGLSLDWIRFSRKKDDQRAELCRAFKSMKRLRTINIRNLPPIDLTEFELLEELQAGFANTFLAIFDEPVDFDGGEGPPGALTLKTLGIGSLFYRDARNTPCHEHDKELVILHRLLRLQIYSVNQWHQFDGQRRRLATRIETGTYEKSEAEGRDVTIFKPYWLA